MSIMRTTSCAEGGGASWLRERSRAASAARSHPRSASAMPGLHSGFAGVQPPSHYPQNLVQTARKPNFVLDDHPSREPLNKFQMQERSV